MKILISILLSGIAVGMAGFAIVHEQQIVQTISYGATANASANALYEQSLAQPLGTGDASMYVTSGADVQGNLLPVNSYQCLSVDTGQPNFEAICGTVAQSSNSGLTLTISIRGLSTQTGTTSNASYIFTHRRGADVRITDFPALVVVNNQLNGVQQIPNPVFYSSNFTPTFWSTTASNTLATIGIVNSTAQAGCGNGNYASAGCFQLGTALQVASSTVLGGTNAYLVLAAQNSTDTPTIGCAVGYTTTVGAGCNVVATLKGKINQLWLDIFSTTNVWTGLNTFNATTTFATTTAASSTITNANVTNNLFVGGAITGNGIYDYQDFTSSGTWTKPSGLTGNEMVTVEAWGQGGGGGGGNSGTAAAGGGGGGACVIATFRLSDLTSSVTVTVGSTTNGGSGATVGGSAGANTTFGTFLTAYGGGGGQAGVSNTTEGGGGGGGALSTGANGTTNGGSGGNPGGGAGGSGTGPDSSGFGGGAGGGSGNGGKSAYGGGGGGGSGSGAGGGAGGSSYCGGGGGGSGSSGSAGTSVLGGAGGATSGLIGQPPGGGGAGGNGGGSSAGGSGAHGEVRVWVIK